MQQTDHPCALLYSKMSHKVCCTKGERSSAPRLGALERVLFALLPCDSKRYVVHLAVPWYPDPWSHTSQHVAVCISFGLTFQSTDFR